MRWPLYWIAGLIAFLGLLWALWGAPAHSEERVDVALVLVMDVSGSMRPDEIDFARRAHASAIASPPVVSAIMDGAYGRIAVGYVEYADRAVVRIDWMIVDGPEAALALSDAIVALPSGNALGTAYTLVGDGLLIADKMLNSAPLADRLVVDVVGDGRATDEATARLGREAILSRGASINALPILIAPDKDLGNYFATNVIGGPGAFSIPITDMSQLPQAIRSKIALELF